MLDHREIKMIVRLRIGNENYKCNRNIDSKMQYIKLKTRSRFLLFSNIYSPHRFNAHVRERIYDGNLSALFPITFINRASKFASQHLHSEKSCLCLRLRYKCNLFNADRK